MVKVLFVCLGNICRSPTADAVFRKAVEDAGLDKRIQVDSAGTGNWHIGHPPDRRASAAAAERGYDLSKLRARAVCVEDFQKFDHILAMDENNMSDLTDQCPAIHRHKLRLFLDFAPQYQEINVPDPYYGGDEGFDHVLDLVEAASDGLLTHIQAFLK